MLVTGPVGAGKSHLVHVFAELSGAAIFAAEDLAARDPVELARHPALAVEDLGEGVDETALFHLLNAARQAGRRVLLTAATPPSEWGLRLADLASRLRAATPVALREPDDALLEALLAKLFSDRQTMVDPSVIAFLARRMERSFAAAHDLVAALDREALAAQDADHPRGGRPRRRRPRRAGSAGTPTRRSRRRVTHSSRNSHKVG